MISSLPMNVAMRSGELGRAVATARNADLTIGDDLERAMRLSDSLGELANEPDLPVKPLSADGDIVEQLEAQAAARRNLADRRDLADKLRAPAVGDLDRLVRAAIPTWLTQLQGPFADTVAHMREVAPDVPRVPADQLGNLNPEQFTHWQGFARLAAQADAIVHAREGIVDPLSEQKQNAMNNAALPVIAAITMPEQYVPATYDNLGMSMHGDLASMRADRYEAFSTLGKEQANIAGVTRWLDLLEAEQAGWAHLHLGTLEDVQHRRHVLRWWFDAPRYVDAASHREARTHYRADTFHTVTASEGTKDAEPTKAKRVTRVAA